MTTNITSHSMENGVYKESENTLLHKNEAEKKEDGDDECGWRCASKYSSCNRLQVLATPKWSLAFLSLASFAHSLVLHGLVGVVISTLEKRFELRSMESGLIVSMGNVGQGVITFLCMFVSSHVDKPRVIGWGLVVAGLATIIFGMPHFTAPQYSIVEGDIFNYCGNVTESDCTVTSLKNYLYWFIACCCLIGVGTAPMTIYSVTYLDENVQKRDSTLYCALYYAIGGLGPAVGFVFGGMTLEIYAYPLIDQDELTINSGSYSWIGAWWIGFVASGALMILIAIPLLLLPKRLPGTEKHRSDRDVDAQKSHFKSSERNETHSDSAVIFSDILSLLRNKPYILMTFGSTMNYGLIHGFNTFGAKYLESVFGLTPFHSAVLYGIAAIFASFGAQFSSGLIVKKFNLQVIGILKFMIIAGILSVVCSIGFVVHCQDIDFVGGTVPYSYSDEAISLTTACNDNCSCSTDRYEPVCAGGVTYFSPCFAGCKTQLNDTFYTDCSCVMKNLSRVDHDVVVSSEICDWKPCNKIILFMFVVFICFFTSILTMPTAMQVILRCVPFSKRDMAMSLQTAVCLLVGVIPGRLLVGFVLDEACAAWSTECGEQGSCRIYRRGDIARNNTILLISQTTVCVLAYALVLFTYKPVGENVSDVSALEKIELANPGEKAETK